MLRDDFLDGFYVFDGEGALVAEWHLKDHFVPSDDEGPDGLTIPLDTSHANAVWYAQSGGRRRKWQAIWRPTCARMRCKRPSSTATGRERRTASPAPP